MDADGVLISYRIAAPWVNIPACPRPFPYIHDILSAMDVVAFTRQLVDIESITGNEGPVGDFLHQHLVQLGYNAIKMPVEGARMNVIASPPQETHPTIFLSTHMETVPPFIPSRRTTIAFMDGDLAMPKELSLPRSQPLSVFDKKASLSAYCSLSVKSGTAWERRSPTSNLTAANF